MVLLSWTLRYTDISHGDTLQCHIEQTTLLLLLTCATWEAKPHIRFKAKGLHYFWEAMPILQWQESDFCLWRQMAAPSISTSTIFIYLWQGREIFLQEQHPWCTANDRPPDIRNDRFYEHVICIDEYNCTSIYNTRFS